MDDNSYQKTISTPPSDIIKINLYRKLMFVCDAFEDYYRIRGFKARTYPNVISARLIALFLSTQSALKRTKSIDYPELKRKIYSNKIEELEETYFIINEWMDTKKIIRVDNIKDIDLTRVELENEEKGT